MKANAKTDTAFLGVRCSANDTEQGLCKFAESKNFVMPVLNDANGEMTSYFKVRNTPSFALLDKEGKLRYFGSFDDAPEEAEVTKPYLPNALKSLQGGKTVSVTTTRPFG